MVTSVSGGTCGTIYDELPRTADESMTDLIVVSTLSHARHTVLNPQPCLPNEPAVWYPVAHRRTPTYPNEFRVQSYTYNRASYHNCENHMYVSVVQPPRVAIPQSRMP